MLWSNCRCLRFLLVLAFATACCDLPADDKLAQKMSGWQRLFRKQAAGYKIVVDGDDGGEAELVPEPILQWSQPVRGGADGAVFVWTLAGRPITIGTLFIWPQDDGSQGVAHELHSLSQSPLIATWRDRKWTPPQDSIVWMPVPAAPAPAAKAEQRLRQMRDLARQFSGESYDKSDRKWDLRPLARPIYRYALDHKQEPDRKQEALAANREVLDGALFGFVEGTDLEIVLSIQARKTTAGYRWEYALSRMSDFRLIAKLADKPIWEVGGGGGYDKPRKAYHCSTVETRMSADEE